MRRILLSLFVLILLSACRPASDSTLRRPSPKPTTPTTQPASDEEAILSLIRAENEAVVAQDIERLATLWAEDALVRDAHHTADDESDDAVWRGIDAVLDRYVVLVFPGNSQFAEPGDVRISMQGDQAQAQSTTQIGDEISPDGDLWTLTRVDGHWRLQSLTYNLEPNP